MSQAAPRTERDVPDALRNFDLLPNSAFVRVNVMAARYSVVPMTIYRWSKSGRLPKPKKLGPNVTAWNVGEVRAADMTFEAESAS